jgi:hypothetical protein
MYLLVTFADAVGRVSGVSSAVTRTRVAEFAAARGLAEPLSIDSLGTLLWSVPESVEDGFANELAEACSVPCLGRSLADLRALTATADEVASEQFGEAYSPQTHRFNIGDEIWELGLAMCSELLSEAPHFKSRRVGVIRLVTPRDAVVSKLRLKPPGSRLDWGKSVARVLRPMSPQRSAILMCRGLSSIEKIFLAAEEASLARFVPTIPPHEESGEARGAPLSASSR